MIDENQTSTPPVMPTAGSLLRQYRQELGIAQDALAQVLRVAPAKLHALENDRLDQLPDAMFARALTLAVCRHLKVEAKPVLDLLPMADASRLAVHNERGLDYPLHRPSFLPQSALSGVLGFFTPLRWAALLVLGLALALLIWPDAQLPANKDSVDHVVVPVTPNLPPAQTSDAAASGTVVQGQMVVTAVRSDAVAAAASAAAQVQTGASDAR